MCKECDVYRFCRHAIAIASSRHIVSSRQLAAGTPSSLIVHVRRFRRLLPIFDFQIFHFTLHAVQF